MLAMPLSCNITDRGAFLERHSTLTKPLAYYDLIETFPNPGCAVCTLMKRDGDRLLDSLLYERVMEPDSHRAFRTARGLCNEHAWQLMSYKGGSLGIATLYNATVDEVLKTLRNVPQKGAPLADKLEPTSTCMACKLLADSERDYLHVFQRYISDPRVWAAFESSPEGFCLPHFRLALRQSYPPDLLRKIVETQKVNWERLRANLLEFIDKNRHERMHEEMGAEKDSWQRAIAAMAGANGMFGIERRSAK